MPERAEQIRTVLSRLVDGRALWGASVVSRDGIAVASQMARPVSDDSFSAMTAAMLGAAEGALMEWADERPQRATIDCKSVRLTVQVLDDDFVLAVVSPIGLSASITPNIEIDAAAVRLRGILHGTRPVLAQVQT